MGTKLAKYKLSRFIFKQKTAALSNYYYCAIPLNVRYKLIYD